MDNFSGSLRLFYQEHELQEAAAIVDGTIKFSGLNFAETWPEISPEHKNFLELYYKINKIKASFRA
jgi:hypothetical protein